MFYGWIMVGVAFVTQFISAGVIFYTFGVALKQWTVEFDAGRLGVSGIHFVMPWAGAAMAPVIGSLAGAGRLRLLIPTGAVCAGLGFCAISQATALWQLYVVYPLLMAFAAGTLSGVGGSTLVVNWFARTRATALGISQIGASVGGMIMAPLTASLFAEHGWRDVYLGFGIAILAVAPVLAWLIVGRPQDRGLEPDGVPVPSMASPAAARVAAHPTPPDSRAALRDPNLWRIAFVTGVGMALSSVIVTHLVAMATDSGIEAGRASRLLSLMAMIAAFGKLVFGRLADRAGERFAYGVAIVLEIVAFVGLMILPTNLLLEGTIVILGLGIGANLPLSAALLARTFGTSAFASMMGLKMLLITPLVSTGTPFAGWIFDETGSYRIAMGVFTTLLGLSLLALRGVEPAAAPASARAAAAA